MAQRRPRRLLRMRPVPQRAEHGLDLALISLRAPPRTEPAPARSADPCALRALGEENALLSRELGRVQARATQWRNDCIAQAERLEALLMRARGDNIVKETRLAVLRDALATLHGRAARGINQQEPVRGITSPRVLCVGGRARQVPIYRELVERRGGRFAHVDGVDSRCLPGLRQALAEADFVILQPGYACQGACQAVEAHCARRGIRCVQLAQACAIGFARSLDQALAPA
jgi:hypothetical protein